MTLDIGRRYKWPLLGQLRGDPVETLSLYIDGVQDNEHQIDLKDLADALKPYLEDREE